MEAEKSVLSMTDNLIQLLGTASEIPSAVAIGAFDGIHIGHKQIINNMVSYSEKKGFVPTVILFDPLPAQFFGKMDSDQRILLRSEQEAKISAMGVERIIVLPFSQMLADLSAYDFMSAVKTVLQCERLFMGEDFSVGKDREGTPPLLSSLGKELGFSTEVITKYEMDGDKISSTRIRALLKAGKLPEANRLLGYPFFFSGPIIHGMARGRKLGFPTLNIQLPQGKIRIPNGVYAVNVQIDGNCYPSVTNIGVRPTFDLERMGVVVESFLLFGHGDFYGKSVKLEIMEKLRDEIRFDSAEELKAQIAKDIESAKSILLCSTDSKA